MTSRPTLSRFTPSLMPADLLERLFVGRERLLQSVVDRVAAAASGSGRNHTLLVGPRGAGKTHLVALAHHRARQLRDAGSRLQLSWLAEDPWTIATYRHLLLAVADGADLPHARDAKADELEDLISTSAESAGPVVVFVENLDQILDQIGNDGQQRLRHLLQNHRSLLLVATTTRLDRNLSDQSRPFYGFFTTTRLDPFDVDEAGAMLRAIASESGQPELVDYLDTDEGRARLRTVAHLAGGQPRMWAALASSLSVRGLRDLVDLLLTRFDDLTPYYQEQLARLSARQRLVVAELATVDRPLNVKDLAERLDVDQRSLAKTMSELVERGWAATVTSPLLEGLVDRRHSYYELAEPMARLAFQIKESRGEPLRIVVDFLKNWFDPNQLRTFEVMTTERSYLDLAITAQSSDSVVSVIRRLHKLPATRAPAVELLDEVDAALRELQRGRSEPFLGLPTPIRLAVEALADRQSLTQVRLAVHDLAMAEFGHIRHPNMAGWLLRAEELVGDEEGRLQYISWLGRCWQFEEALVGLAMTSDDFSVIDVRSDIAFSAWSAGQFELAGELQESVVHDCERVLGPRHPNTLTARANLAIIHIDLGRDDSALVLMESVLAAREGLLGHSHPETLTSRAVLAITYSHLDRDEEAIVLEESVLNDRERLLGHDHPDTLSARENLAVTQNALGRYDLALNLEQSVLDGRERLLGFDHPETLLTRSNLAATLHLLGRSDEARTALEVVLADSARVLGTEHPVTLQRRELLEEIQGSV